MKARDVSIHLYNDPASIIGIAVANGIARISDLKDASQYDMSSRVRTIKRFEIAIIKNIFNNYAAIRVINIRDKTRNGEKDYISFDYVINPKGKLDFS